MQLVTSRDVGGPLVSWGCYFRTTDSKRVLPGRGSSYPRAQSLSPLTAQGPARHGDTEAMLEMIFDREPFLLLRIFCL
jgi:hypothetical protein